MPRQTLDAGWVAREGGALSGLRAKQALTLPPAATDRERSRNTTHHRLGPGDAGEVSYYNLEKQTPAELLFLLGRAERERGREVGPKGSCTRPSSMRAREGKRDHTIGHHQQAACAYFLSLKPMVSHFLFAKAVWWVSRRAALAPAGRAPRILGGGGKGGGFKPDSAFVRSLIPVP